MLLGLSEVMAAGPDSPLAELVTQFAAVVNNRDFPCVYSTLPFTTGMLHFGLIGPGRVEEGAVAALRELCGIIQDQPDAVGVIFVDEPDPGGLADDLEQARRIVAAVMRRNAQDHPGVRFPEPSDPEWMLWLDGVGLFLNFSSPRHVARRSRNVGPRLTVIAQARESFDRVTGARPRVREEIRRRVNAYDAVPAHPCLGTYREAGSREAHQYFLGDSTEALDITGGCHDDP